MRPIKFDPGTGKLFSTRDEPEDGLSEIHDADNGSGGPLVIPAVGSALTLPYGSGGNLLSGAFTRPDSEEYWDFNFAVGGILPGGWTTAMLRLEVYDLSGGPGFFKRLDSRRYATGETEFFLNGSCQLFFIEGFLSYDVRISQSGAAAQTIVTWSGFLDAHFAHRTA